MCWLLVQAIQDQSYGIFGKPEEQVLPNKALQLTANPLRGLSAAELGRYVAKFGSTWSERPLSTIYSRPP